MVDVERIIAEFEGQMVGTVVIVYEDGMHKVAASQLDGKWEVSEEFKARLGDAKPVEKPVAANKSKAK